MLIKSFVLKHLLSKKLVTFFSSFFICFPVIATSIFHLWAIKHYSYSLHMALAYLL